MVGSSYTNVFGGQTIYPAQLNFKAIALTANLALSWPAEIATTSDVVANIMRVTPSGAGFSITLDDATLASNGVSLLFSNAGADSFTVKDWTGGTIATIASGLAWDVILRDNATAAGSWMVIQRGAGSSSAQAAALAGPGLIAINDLLATAVTVQERNTDFAFGSASRAILYDWTGGAGDATIDNPSSFMSGWWSAFRNDGSGALTLTPDSGTIDGSSDKVANPGSAFFIFTDGTDFFTIGGGEVTGAGFDYTSIDISAASGSTYTLSGSELNRIAYNFTGALSDAVEVVVPGTVQEYWCTDATTGGEQVSIRTSIQTPPGIIIPTGETIITYCDGSDVRSASASGISTPISIADGGTGATTDSGARANLGASVSGDAVFTGTAAAGRTALGLGALAVLSSVDAAHIDSDAVTTVKILDTNVTTPKIAANAITFAKMQAITDGVLLGASGGTAVEEITVGTGLSLSGNTLSATAGSSPTVRQTVLSGPVDANGLPNFGGATGSTTVTATGTLIAAAANGFTSGGGVDRVGSIVNPSWTGLSTNGTMYLYLDIAANGTCTTGSTTLAPTYQWGGTYSTTNAQFTFNIQEMVGKVGNGATAAQTYRIFVGQVTVAGSVVTVITWYALLGRYETAVFTSTLPGASTTISVAHNIGVAPLRAQNLVIKCTSTDNGYAVGDIVFDPMYITSSVLAPLPALSSRTSTSFATGDGVGFYINPKTGGVATLLTAAKWSYSASVVRGW